MPKRAPYTRVATSIPKADLAEADRLAKQQDRSRSWVIAEAIRRYAGSQASAQRSGAGAADIARVEQGLGAARRAQLIADLRLSPEERVRAAEETARVSFLYRPPIGRRVIAFDRYEDYLQWKRLGELGE